jgi:hypothetical protein
MTKDEALKLALEALHENTQYSMRGEPMAYQDERNQSTITAIKEVLAQPEFIKHEVKNADDWSEWVCPDPKGYLMKCCDCGLVHEAEFGVARYKSETERDDCDMVDDPNLQAVFRMRRSEEWTPEDTAHRVGGLPMAQPEQDGQCKRCTDGCPACDVRKLPEQEPVAYMSHNKENFVSADDVENSVPNWTDYYPTPLYTIPPPCPTCEALARTVMLDQTSHDATPKERKPLTDKQILADETLRYYFGQNGGAGPVSKQGRKVVNAIEALHGIKEVKSCGS